MGVGAAKPKNGGAFLLYLLLVGIEYSGVAGDYQILKVLRIPTLVLLGTSALVIKSFGGKVFNEYRESKLVTIWTAMTCLSFLWAVVRTYAINSISSAVGNLVFCLAGAYLIDRRSRIFMMAWLVALLEIYLVVRNIPMLLLGERVGSFAGPYFASDGNEYAWAMNMMGPISLFLFIGTKNIIARLVGLGAFVLGLFAIVGTQSRGATLGLAAAVPCYILFVAKRKAAAVIGLAVLAVGVLAIAPGAYFDRMGTIASHEDDSSATLRLQAWGAAIRMATHYPLGVGAANFNSAYGRYYMPDDPAGYAGRRWVSTHSVYFKVLGEAGFPGAILVLTLIFTAVRSNLRVRALVASDPGRFEFPPGWPGLITMSLVAWAVNGAFLGGFVYPHLFLVLALGIGAMRMSGYQPAAATVPAVPQRAASAGTPGVRAPLVQPVPPARSGALVPTRPAGTRRLT